MPQNDLRNFKQLFPKSTAQPKIQAVANDKYDEPLIEIVRSRLEGLGPVTVTQLAAPLALETVQIESALLKLEQEGFVVRGHFYR